MVNVDQTDMKEEFCVDCANINLDVPGEMSTCLGLEKQMTSALAAAKIDGIMKLKTNEFAVCNGIIYKL